MKKNSTKSIGDYINTDVLTLDINKSISDCFIYIRENSTKFTNYNYYVTNKKSELIGTVTLRKILQSDQNSNISEIFEDNLIYADKDKSCEDVANLISKYDLLSLPIVDENMKLLGVVSSDRVIDIIREESTKDIEQMAAIAHSETPYLETSVFTLFKNRIVWLILLMIAGMIIGVILERFEVAIATLPILVTFIPMLNDTAGNSGSQSCAIIIRGISLGELKIKDLFKVLFKELNIALLCGSSLFIFCFFKIVGIDRLNFKIAFIVSISVFLTVIIAKTLGGTLPLLAKVFHIDPAIVAAPLVTTLADAFAVLVYFSIICFAFGIVI